MNKKLLFVLTLLIISLISFGCSQSEPNENSSTSNSKIINQENKQTKDRQKENQKKESQQTDSKKEINKKYIICIDPGHQTKGDMDEEPVGPNSSETKFKVSWGTQGVATNIPEYELNLSASKILKKYIEDMGFEVIMTRETNDVNITNSERAIFANENDADLVVRIHADGSEDSSVSGASLHIPAKDGKYTSKIYEESNKCAQIMFSNMKKDGFKMRDIYERRDLTGFNWSKVPVVLVEMGFMSNTEEDKKMAEKSYQEKMMKSVAESVQTYFE